MTVEFQPPPRAAMGREMRKNSQLPLVPWLFAAGRHRQQVRPARQSAIRTSDSTRVHSAG